MGIKNIFKRYELKFMLTTQQRQCACVIHSDTGI